VGPRAGIDAVAKRKKSLSLARIKPRSSHPYPSQYTDLGTPTSVSLPDVTKF